MQITYVFKPRFGKKAIICEEMRPVTVSFSKTLDPKESFRRCVSLSNICLPNVHHVFYLSTRVRDCAIKSLVLGELLQSDDSVFVNDFCK